MSSRNIFLYRLATRSLLILFTMSCCLHVLVLLQIVPYTIVGGGRIETLHAMYVLESIALAVNLFFLLLVLVRMGFILPRLPRWITSVLLGLMTLVFALNTLGNLLAKSSLETWIFTPVTSLCVIFGLILLRYTPRKVSGNYISKA
jgi:hypothetical protein